MLSGMLSAITFPVANDAVELAVVADVAVSAYRVGDKAGRNLK